MKKSFKPIPRFKNERDEREFWSTHDTTDYIDFSKSLVVSGSIVEVKTGKNKTAVRLAKLQESRRVDFSKVPLDQALVMGDPVAPKKVAVFTDPD